MMPTEGSMSYDFDSEEDECTACDEASMVLTEMDWEVLEEDGYELVCDPACFTDATMDGCGAFGLPIECRAVPIDEAPAPAPTPVAAPVSTGDDEGEGGGEDSEETGSGEGTGGGEDSEEETGSGEGTGGGEDSEEETGSGEGTGEGGGGDSCTSEEINMCNDISPAQVCMCVCVCVGRCNICIHEFDVCYCPV